ncbi:hypothetical protein BB559_004805 [Furculomyces boomerangus]|uniref:Uncharacterized protein n=2 Tax=Harpellales TaxID=61421 RepID=A0A2T9YCL5_9FUNG|nr:hypothetical protein BB559_004805 [Furculomyces boomerangus]PWA02891.1 hypothetical protein BB558_000933 [Smittium angustum]
MSNKTFSIENCEWSIGFINFFEKINLSYTSRALGLESNVFGKPIHKNTLIEALKDLGARVVEELETNIKEEFVAILKRDNENTFGNDVYNKLESLKKNFLQVPFNNEETFERMNDFIDTQKAFAGESNKKEFLLYSENGSSSARINASAINRGVQIQRDVVENVSFNTSMEKNNLDTYEGLAKSVMETNKSSNNGIEERIGNIQTHIGVTFEPERKFSLYERVISLEEKIMYLERFYPEWSASHFIQPGVKKPKGNVSVVKRKRGRPAKQIEKKSLTESIIEKLASNQ